MTSHPFGWLLSGKADNNKCWVRMWGNWNPCALLVGMPHCGVWQFFKKFNIEPAYDPTIPLLSIYPKDVKAGTGRDISRSIFMAALFTIAKRWKQPK